MNPHYSFVADRAEHRCEYCRAPEKIFNFVFEVEHIFPKSRDGGSMMMNLALACRACNLFKANHQTGLDPLTGEEVRLFHPRRDRWAEHFEVEFERGMICGLTDIGRATVQRLQMNRQTSLTARLQWMKLELFP